MSGRPAVVALLVGAAGLMLEVLWIRVAGFAMQGLPGMFAVILAMYLLGVALGARLGRRLCHGQADAIRRRGAWVLLLSGVVDLAALALFARQVGTVPPMLLLMPLVLLTAVPKSALFPVVHHLGSNDTLRWKGTSFSKVYFFNVLGCTLGPLLVTLWGMDVLATEQLFLAVALTTWMAALVLTPRGREQGALVTMLVLGLAVLPSQLPPVMRTVAEATAKRPVDWLIERKEGVIHTVADADGTVVYGGNVYDGRINTDLRRNSNRIDRVYAVMAAHPHPQRVLVVGMSGGSWTRVITGFPVTRVDVVEIHPGYRELVARHAEVAPLLDDRRVQLHIGDGRQWLARHAGQYDVIVVNSTFHWRSGVTALLSREFMALLQAGLRPGGVALLNATGSPDVLRTATDVFAHAWLYGNTVLMSDTDFRPTLRDGRARLLATVRDGQAVFDEADADDNAAIAAVVETALVDVDSVDRQTGRVSEVITDWNMLSEYRHASR